MKNNLNTKLTYPASLKLCQEKNYSGENLNRKKILENVKKKK